MTIDSIADLKKILKLCRDNGVSAIEIDGIKLQLNLNASTVHTKKDMSAPTLEEQIKVPAYNGPVTTVEEDNQAGEFEGLTDEQKLNWSSAPGGIESGPQ